MRTNEEQLELFADLLEPAAEIIADDSIKDILSGKGKPVTAVKMAIKNHKAAVVEILARLDGVEPSEYKVPGPAALTLKLLELLNNSDVTELFTTQGQKSAADASGSAMANTEDGAN